MGGENSMLGFGAPPERTIDGAIISRNRSWGISALFVLVLSVFGLFSIYATDVIWMTRNGILVNATVLENHAKGTENDPQYYAWVAYTPVPSGTSPPTEIRTELRNEGAYEIGSAISIYYHPRDLKYVQMYYFPEDWVVLYLIWGVIWSVGAWLGFNLIRRMRGDIVFVPIPEHIDYTPTAAEDAEFDRNQAAGTPVIRALVDGKWVHLKGKALEDEQAENRKTLKTFMAVGVLCMVFGAGSLAFWMALPVAIFAVILFVLGAGFFTVGYFALRQEKRR
jgi:hypothetical protein